MGCRNASDKCLSVEPIAVGNFLTSEKAGIYLGRKRPSLTSPAMLPGLQAAAQHVDETIETQN